MKYKFIDEITSDVMYDAYGKDKKELFENAAEALFNIICEIKKIILKKKIKVKVEGEDLKDLLYNWLQELIAEVDIKEMFFSKFNIKKITENRLEAEIFGEPISKKNSGTVVKAVTYYNFDLKKTEKGYKARVAFDI